MRVPMVAAALPQMCVRAKTAGQGSIVIRQIAEKLKLAVPSRLDAPATAFVPTKTCAFVTKHPRSSG